MAKILVSPYDNMPQRQYWRKAVTDEHVLTSKNLWFKKVDINLSDRIVSAGSCFAQHISRRLVSSGYNFVDVELAPKALPANLHKQFGYATYSGRYGNIYTTSQLIQLAEESLDRRPMLTYSWEKEGCFYDPLRPSVEPNGLGSHEEVVFHRKYHLSKFRHLIETCDVFVFTLGLTETWICNRSGRSLPTAPGTIAGSYDPKFYTFRNLSHSEIKADLIRFINLVHEIQGNNSCKFLFTVSPVPLTATFTDNHALVATMHSKSTLRSVVGELYSEFDFVDYFPSYEVINAPWSRGLFFESNQRNVSAAGVDAAMRIFFLQHDLKKSIDADASQSNESNTEILDEDLVCEDALLEGFAK